MKRWVQSRRDSAETIEKIRSSLKLGLEFSKSAQVSCEEPEDGTIFVHLDGLVFVQAKDGFIPFLGSSETLALFPSVTVDEGAIKFLLNGADIMRPGIRTMDEWGESGRMVVVKEQGKGRAIAIGTASVSSLEAKGMTKGSALKNIHHVGDRYWTLYKQV